MPGAYLLHQAQEWSWRREQPSHLQWRSVDCPYRPSKRGFTGYDDGIPGVTVSLIREYTMASEFSELSIEPRGNDYVLKVSDREGATSEIILSEETVIFLGRLAPTIARQIVASKARAEGDISASVAAAAKDFELNTDIHDQLVLLRIRDEFDAEFDFSFLPSGAKYLGERLIAWSEKLESAPKRTTQ
jgi:hypothetical protein